MKKLIILLISLSFIGCDKNNVEAQKSAGEWMMEGSQNQGKKYIMGDDVDVDLAMKFMDGYENMDPQTMVDLSADIVKFHPGDLAGVFDVDMTNTDFIVERQKDMDSVSRNYIFITPLKMEGTSVRFVQTSFNETTYLKDGSSKSVGVYEKLYINTDNKISRVVQWHRPSN
jgi:hypothetical protein